MAAKTVPCYILITHGPKPAGKASDHPGAKSQFKYFRKKIAEIPELKPRFFYDYARKINGLESLPALAARLERCGRAGRIKILIDDLSRLFRATEYFSRRSFLVELKEFGDALFSVRHGKTLSEFSDIELEILIEHSDRIPLLSRRGHSRDTSKAREASARARSKTATETTGQLEALYADLLKTNQRVTYKMVAELANERGLVTSRGKKWTAQNVGRLLDKSKV